MSHALFFRLRESSNPRPKGHIEMGSTLTTNWATSSVGSESAPHFNMSLWSWVQALTEAKEKGMGHAPIACEWDHPSSEWARGWGPCITCLVMVFMNVNVYVIRYIYQHEMYGTYVVAIYVCMVLGMEYD